MNSPTRSVVALVALVAVAGAVSVVLDDVTVPDVAPPIVVEVRSSGPGDWQQSCLGVLADGGLVVTAAHCLLDGEFVVPIVEVRGPGRSWVPAVGHALSGSVFESTTGRGDVAVLIPSTPLDGRRTAMRFAQGDQRPGSGTAFDVEGKVATWSQLADCDASGVVCGDRALAPEERLCPGDSGAPLLDGDGFLVGVFTRGGPCSSDEPVRFSLLLSEDASIFNAERLEN